MNNFELFKLKAAGLTNLNILNILDYQKTQDRKLSLRDMAVVSKSKNAVLFMEKYKSLDIKQLKEQFDHFPTLSIFDKEYPIELKYTYNPPVPITAIVFPLFFKAYICAQVSIPHANPLTIVK